MSSLLKGVNSRAQLRVEGGHLRRTTLLGVAAASVRKITLAYCTQSRSPAYDRQNDRLRLDDVLLDQRRDPGQVHNGIGNVVELFSGTSRDLASRSVSSRDCSRIDATNPAR